MCERKIQAKYVDLLLWKQTMDFQARNIHIQDTHVYIKRERDKDQMDSVYCVQKQIMIIVALIWLLCLSSAYRFCELNREYYMLSRVYVQT